MQYNKIQQLIQSIQSVQYNTVQSKQYNAFYGGSTVPGFDP